MMKYSAEAYADVRTEGGTNDRNYATSASDAKLGVHASVRCVDELLLSLLVFHLNLLHAVIFLDPISVVFR